MSKNLIYVGIAVLAIIAVVLGYKIYQQQAVLENQPTVSNSQSVVKQDVAKQSSTDSPQTTNPTPAQEANTAEEENLIKSVPLPTSTLEERIAFNNKIKKYEKETGEIQITNCKPSPLIFTVKGETAFKIKNNDSVDYKISIGSQKTTLPSSGSVTLTAGKADGITDISCNGGIQGLVHMHE